MSTIVAVMEASASKSISYSKQATVPWS